MPPLGGTGGSGAAAGAGSGGGTSAAAGTTSNPPGELPVPPGAADQPVPSGPDIKLRVLPWAGFDAAVSYTIDDSQPSQIDHFAELDALGVRMTFYINPVNNWYAGYDATWQSARASGHELGNHTTNHCHADLSGCEKNLGSVEAEIDDCTSYIETKLGQPDVWTFAFPFGDTGFEPASKTRFLLARGVSSGTVAAADSTDPFNLPTIAAAGGEAASVFSGSIDSAASQKRWLIFLFHSILPTSQNWYAGVDIGSITGSVEHAKTLGNVWLDSVVNVGAYWLGQRALEGATPMSAGQGATWTWSLPDFFPSGRVLRVVVDGGTLSQDGSPLAWDAHGYYTVALDARTLTWSP